MPIMTSMTVMPMMTIRTRIAIMTVVTRIAILTAIAHPAHQHGQAMELLNTFSGGVDFGFESSRPYRFHAFNCTT